MAIVANDAIGDWLLPFLESWKRTNAEIPLYLIPYDDNLELTRRAAKVYGVTIVENEPVAIDRLAKDLFPFNPGRRRRLRKLQSLALPLDEVIYIDVDIVLFRDMRPLFGHLKKGETDFIIASPSFEYVYNDRKNEHAFLKNAMLFNDGFFVTSNRIIDLDMFISTIERDKKLFNSVRKRGMLFAQPLVNFVCHRNELAIRIITDVVPTASHETFYKATGVTWRDGAPVDQAGRDIYFCHWAGGGKSLPSNGPFDAAWKDFAAGAHKRLGL
jgi:hypothetical protein